MNTKKGIIVMCQNCIHYVACQKFGVLKSDFIKCEIFKDKELYLELPCKIGDTVYVVRQMTQKECIEAGVEPYIIRINNHISKSVSYTNRPYKIIETKMKQSYYNLYGKTVFLTYNEALNRRILLNKKG